MQNKKQKLSIYIQCETSRTDVVFDVVPGNLVESNQGMYLFQTQIPTGKTSTVRVILTEKKHPRANIRIAKVTLNDVTLNNFDQWSRYITYHHGLAAESTYGYMSEPGEYILRIHQNPMVHNYLSFFRSKCSTS